MLQITDYENFDVADETFEVPVSDILNNSPEVLFLQKHWSLEMISNYLKSNIELAEKDLPIAERCFDANHRSIF